jgi:hypothetical protein
MVRRRDGGAVAAMTELAAIKGVVIRGHRVASGTSEIDRRFPQGSILMQTPLFKRQGLDLTAYFGGDFFKGTLNVSIEPLIWEIVKPEYIMHGVRWTDLQPAENFFLSPAALAYCGQSYRAMLYIPDPTTKHAHFNPPHIIDVLAAPIPGIGYGSEVELSYNPAAVRPRKPYSRARSSPSPDFGD